MTSRTYLLPTPPSVNRMYRRVGTRMIKSQGCRLWEKQAGLDLMAQRPAQFRGRVHIDLVFGFPDNRVRDGDNYVKATLDLLRHMGVIEDDNSRIVASHSVDMSKEFSGAKVTITPMTEERIAA